MANRRMEFLIGMTVLTVFITIIVMTILFGSNHSNLFQFNHGQKMSILFDKAPGIKNTSRVTKSGIEIGRVYRSDLIDDVNGTQVHVYFSLNDPKTKIYSNEQARITRTILGESEIEFVKNRKYQGEVHELTTEDIIVGISGGDIMGTVNNIEEDLTKAIQSINITAQEAARFIGNMNDFMGTESEINMKKEKLAVIFTELGETLKVTRGLAANMDEIISDPQIKENIRKSTADIPNILSKVDNLLVNGENLSKRVQETIDLSQKTIEKMGNNLDNVEAFTDSLSNEGPEFISNLNASSKDINKMVTNISALSENIVTQMNNKGTPLGMLTDEEVGESIHGIVRNVEATTEKIHPILDDARVFTNKIAHRPSSLIFSKSTYKGEPSLTDRSYGYQPYSPGGGLNSPLYSPSGAYDPTETESRYSRFYGRDEIGSDPNTLENYYASHPETAQVIRKENHCLGGCLTDRLGKFCFSKRNQDDVPEAGFTTDIGAYYGLSDPLPADGNGPFVTQADLAQGEYLVDANGERVAAKSCLGQGASADGTAKDCGAKIKFSLASAFHKVFKCRGKEETIAEEPNVLPMDVVYQPGDWSQIDGRGVTEPTCEPTCEPSCEPEPTCAPGRGGDSLASGYPDSTTPMFDPNAEFSFPTDSPISSPSPDGDGARTEELPEEAIQRQGESSYQASPMNPGYSSGGNGVGQNGGLEIPLGPLPQSASGFQSIQPPAPKKAAPDGQSPSPPVRRPRKSASTRSVPVGAATNQNAPAPPAPAAIPTRSFVDDGLPIQFTPNR